MNKKERLDLQKAIKIIEEDLVGEEITLLEKWELSIFHESIWENLMQRKKEYYDKVSAWKKGEISNEEFQKEYGLYSRNHSHPIEETLFYFITRYADPEIYDNPSEDNLKVLKWARHKSLHWI